MYNMIVCNALACFNGHGGGAQVFLRVKCAALTSKVYSVDARPVIIAT